MTQQIDDMWKIRVITKQDVYYECYTQGRKPWDVARDQWNKWRETSHTEADADRAVLELKGICDACDHADLEHTILMTDITSITIIAY